MGRSLTVYEGLRNFESAPLHPGNLPVKLFFEPRCWGNCCRRPKKFPLVEVMVHETYLGEHTLKSHREVYSGGECRAAGSISPSPAKEVCHWDDGCRWRWRPCEHSLGRST